MLMYAKLFCKEKLAMIDLHDSEHYGSGRFSCVKKFRISVVEEKGRARRASVLT
jgi:hypothetical protein